METRSATGVGIVGRWKVGFGTQHHFVATRGDQFTKDLFAFSLGVDIGTVEQIDPDVTATSKQLGGAGFCPKSESTESLLETIIAVSEGRMVFPFMDMSKPGTDPFGLLTGREQELLIALSEGHTNIQIASELGISLNTVKFHLKNLYGKLSVKNRAQAVACYLRAHKPEY